MSSITLAPPIKTWRGLAGLRMAAQRLGANAAIVLIIAYLTLFGQAMAERGQRRLPAQTFDTAIQTLAQTVKYVTHHPNTYTWNKQELPASELVLTSLRRSVALLALALGVALLVGAPMGILIALWRRALIAPLMVLVSVLGISTPSFLLGMLFWNLNVQVAHWLGWETAPLPQVGFGWDAHMVMPVLVLATRPLAHIVQITYISMSNVLGQDYIQTARAKGLARRFVIARHALPNVLVPVLTTTSTALRFSLASLPVVEMFFNWPGAGLTLLKAIEQGNKLLATDLIVSLGLLFVLVNLGLELIYRHVDPRLASNDHDEGTRSEAISWQARWNDFKEAVLSLIQSWRQSLSLWGAPRSPGQRGGATGVASTSSAVLVGASPSAAPSKKRRLRLPGLLGNPALIIGSLLILALFGLAFAGERLAHANPYTLHGITMIEGKVYAPPFKPLADFPWGSDLVGRDVQGLVLAGAKRTLTLALAGMAARVLLGAVLGVLAGWWKNSWLDKAVRGAVAVWAAFPVTLFAMIVIRALGIQNGLGVFVIAICVVGWGETAQFIRSQVISLKPQLFIEAARAVGAQPGRILRWHVLPHLFAPLLVLATLEMGGVLMLLAELGFLNVFLGGGFKLEISPDYIYFFSDVPEWGAMLANIQRWWRAYPWMAWYPGGAFFVAILAFNLWGEGMRRWLDQTRLNVARLANRYTLLAIGALAASLAWLLSTTTPMALYQSQAARFDAQAAMQDIAALASPEFQGRESGTWGSKLTAEYIAKRMQAIGLQPAGENGTYFQSVPAPYFHLDRTPRLEIVNAGGAPPSGALLANAQPLVYRRDFVEYTDFPLSYGWGKGQVVGLAFGPPNTASGQSAYQPDKLELDPYVVVVREADAGYFDFRRAGGVLVVSSQPDHFQTKRLIQRADRRGYRPALYITPEVADRLLAPAGGLTGLDDLASRLPPGRMSPTGVGLQVHLAIEGSVGPEKECRNVIGVIPGSGANMGARSGRGLDSEVILVGAAYDGLGVGPDGNLYPGANYNASGVATLLEIGRVLAAGPYTPIRTVVLVAWCGQERGKEMDVRKVMSAKRGFSGLNVEVAAELTGVGAGSGAGLAIQADSDPHLAGIVRDAAGRLKASIASGPPETPSSRPPAPSRLALGWEGADQTAGRAADSLQAVDPDKLKQVGQTTTLALTIISRELEY